MAHDLARSALWYARHGWRVFPCRSYEDKPEDAKLPAIKAWQKNATTDEAIVQNWWRWPKNIGVACGPATGVYVIDVDNHDGTDGEAALARLIKALGPLPETVEQRTGSGGRQLFFAFPQGREMRNKAGGKKGSTTMPAGIDTRGDGGFVVVPPSIHPCGERYRWIKGPHQQELAALPERWAARFQRKPEVRITVPIVPLRKAQLWHDQRMQQWWTDVATAGTGGRKAKLFGRTKDAAKLTLITGGSMSSVQADMEAAGRAAGLDPDETRKTVISALQSVRRQG